MKNFLIEILKFILGVILAIIKWFLSLFTSDDGTKVVREEKLAQKKEIEKEYLPKHTMAIPPSTNNTKLFTISKKEIKEILDIVLKEEKITIPKNHEELISKVNKEIDKKSKEGFINDKESVKKEIKEFIKKIPKEELEEHIIKESLKKNKKEIENNKEPLRQEEINTITKLNETIYNNEELIFTDEPKLKNEEEIPRTPKHLLADTMLTVEDNKELVSVTEDTKETVEEEFQIEVPEELKPITAIYNDDVLFNEDYDKIGAYTEKKIEILTNEIKNKSLPKEKIIKKEKEVKELKHTKKEIELLKDEELEAIRIDTEYEITIKEKEDVLKELHSMQKSNEEKLKSLELDETIPKINSYLDNYKEYLIRQEINNILNKLTMPLILTFPFIKNKYFRWFTGGVFLHNSFHFIKSLLGGPKEDMYPPDLTAIKTGLDALNNYGDYLKINQNSFYKLKEEISLKYPHLMYDEEFVKEINKIEKILNAKEKKYLKDQEKLNKYFYKGKYMERKLKRKIV